MAAADGDEDVVTDAIDVLTRDHRLIEELFTSFEQAVPQQLDPLARRVCKMLRIHAQIEEELFYPFARRALDEGSVDAAEREHAQAKQLIMRVESMTSNDAHFKPTVLELRDSVAHHVSEEESTIFARLREARTDLRALGITLAERRDTLMDVLGLHNDDEEGALNQREVQQALLKAQRERPSAER